MSEADPTEPQHAALALSDTSVSRLVLAGAGAADIIALLVAAALPSMGEPPSSALVWTILLLVAWYFGTWLARLVIIRRYVRRTKLNSVRTAVAVYKFAMLTAVVPIAIGAVVTLPFGTKVAGLFVRALVLLIVFYSLTIFLTGGVLNLDSIRAYRREQRILGIEGGRP